jgi:hypothetical protein
MQFPSEIQELIDFYIFEPPDPPPRPALCNSANLNRACNSFANPRSYIEYKFKSTGFKGTDRKYGMCRNCYDIVVQSIIDEIAETNNDLDWKIKFYLGVGGVNDNTLLLASSKYNSSSCSGIIRQIWESPLLIISLITFCFISLFGILFILLYNSILLD